MSVPKIKSYLFDITSINEKDFDRLLLGVKQYRKEKIEKLSLKQSKYLSLAVELLIKKACDDFGIDYLNEEFFINEFGKPSFKRSKYFFNTSHSGKYALCVISDIEVGCDIEEIKEYKEKIAKRVFTDKENKYIEISNDKNDMFYRIWTLKESYMKCIGKGFNLAMSSFELDSKDNDIIVKGKENYQFLEQKFDNYRISFCLNISNKDKEQYKHSISLIKI